MKRYRMLFILFIFVFFTFFSTFPKNALAIGFTLTEPEPPFSQGQEVQFTVNVDTQGETLTSTQAEMIFDTDYLEYVSITAGAIFPNVTGTVQEAGILSISANVDTGSSGVTGAGTFAVITFRLIGSPQSEVELCALAEVTPTEPVPTSPLMTPICTATLVPQPTTPPVVTSPPITTLPRSGTVENVLMLGVLGGFFTFFGTGLLLLKVK
jgi:hypothetical protein